MMNTKTQHRTQKWREILTPPKTGCETREGQAVTLSYKTPLCYSGSQYVLDTTIHEPSYKQLVIKNESNIVFMRKAQSTSTQGTQNVKSYDRTKCWTAIHSDIHKIHNKTYEHSFKQLEVKTNRASFYAVLNCGT